MVCTFDVIDDGNWGTWGEWTRCSVTCGTGTKTRRRYCDDPPPSNGGKPCEGANAQKMPCITGIPCPGK